jgi:uncharacterized protein (TIGR00255 family)
MTGYGYREYQDERLQLILELKSYNNRYLDISVYTPSFLSPLEPALREYLKERISRGRVELSLRVKELEEDVSVHLDRTVTERYARVLQELAEAAQLDDSPRIGHFLGIEGVIKQVKNRGYEWFEPIVFARLEEAFADFSAAREREGEATKNDIAAQTEVIRRELERIEAHAGELESRLQEQLRSRFRELVGEQYDENRILSETAVMLMKYAVGEETVRMRSHLEQFESFLQSSGPVGKKMDFICQELNREINTIGSKSTVVEINRAVVLVKDALEKIREQLRNVE